MFGAAGEASAYNLLPLALVIPHVVVTVTIRRDVTFAAVVADVARVRNGQWKPVACFESGDNHPGGVAASHQAHRERMLSAAEVAMSQFLRWLVLLGEVPSSTSGAHKQSRMHLCITAKISAVKNTLRSKTFHVCMKGWANIRLFF